MSEIPTWLDLDEAAEVATETWHESVDAALDQAESEYGGRDWIASRAADATTAGCVMFRDHACARCRVAAGHALH